MNKKLFFAVALLLSFFSSSLAFGQEPKKDSQDGAWTLPDPDEWVSDNLFSATPEKQAYMRIVVNEKVDEGRAYFFRLPFMLDGYYFGADASRGSIEITPGDEGSQTRTDFSPLDDEEDFMPDVLYRVVSDISMNQIVGMVPGVASRFTDKFMASETTDSVLPAYFVMTDEDFDEYIVNTDIVDVVSHKDAATYDLLGRRVGSGYHGIVIRNNKKFVLQ